MQCVKQICLNCQSWKQFLRQHLQVDQICAFKGDACCCAGKGRPGKAAPAADASVHVTTSKPAAAEAAPAAEAEEAMEEDEETAPKAKQGRKPRKASVEAKRPASGNVKLHDSTSGQQCSF